MLEVFPHTTSSKPDHRHTCSQCLDIRNPKRFFNQRWIEKNIQLVKALNEFCPVRVDARFKLKLGITDIE